VERHGDSFLHSARAIEPGAHGFAWRPGIHQPGVRTVMGRRYDQDGVAQGEAVAIVGGFFLVADLRRRQALAVRSAWAGVVTGLAVFQLFDGIVDHKVLRVHQVRYGVDLLPYDLAWNLVGVVLLVAGLVMLRRSRDEGRG